VFGCVWCCQPWPTYFDPTLHHTEGERRRREQAKKLVP
jgi:hypothetical protein